MQRMHVELLSPHRIQMAHKNRRPCVCVRGSSVHRMRRMQNTYHIVYRPRRRPPIGITKYNFDSIRIDVDTQYYFVVVVVVYKYIHINIHSHPSNGINRTVVGGQNDVFVCIRVYWLCVILPSTCSCVYMQSACMHATSMLCRPTDEFRFVLKTLRKYVYTFYASTHIPKYHTSKLLTLTSSTLEHDS